jgi:hypothetical protein
MIWASVNYSISNNCFEQVVCLTRFFLSICCTLAALSRYYTVTHKFPPPLRYIKRNGKNHKQWPVFVLLTVIEQRGCPNISTTTPKLLEREEATVCRLQFRGEHRANGHGLCITLEKRWQFVALRNSSCKNRGVVLFRRHGRGCLHGPIIHGIHKKSNESSESLLDIDG